MSEKAINRILAVLVLVVSLAVYVRTMAVTVSLWDCGEFIATSYILGIPHSPGTPLYVLVGRVFCMFPFALSVAQKVNLLSATFSALGVLMAYLSMVLVVRFMFGRAQTAAGRLIRYAGPLVGSFFLTFSDTYWTDAIEAEVYALSAFVMGLCTLLALKWLLNPSGELSKEDRKRILNEAGKAEAKKLIQDIESREKKHSHYLVFLIIYLLSLGIGFHLGTILVFGGVFLTLTLVKDKAFTNFELLVFSFGLAVMLADMTMHKQSNLTLLGLLVFAALVIWCTVTRGSFVLQATALFILGISVHLFLYIRSGLNPLIDEVDPETWKSLYAHLRREQYPPMNVFLRKASFIFQLRHFGTYFREQYRLFGDFLLGPLNLGKASVIIPMALGFYGMIANFTRERKTWVLNFTSFALNSLGLIIFLNFSDTEVRERDYFYSGAFYFFAFFIGIGASSALMLMREKVEKAGLKFMRLAVPVVLLLVICSLLPARYHWFRHDRSNDFIPRDYAHNMLAGLEPDAIIFTNGDNDTFPLWYIQYVEDFRRDVRVVNRMLLNTSWYIKQVRDEEPKVPISYTDQEVERLHPVRDPKDGSVYWVYALAIANIIQTTNWSRPIYFAVTAPPEVWSRYSDYLELHGMVRLLVPRKGSNMINEYMLERNFDDLYLFRGVLTEDGEMDDSVFKSVDVHRMFGNFAMSASQMALITSRRHDYQSATKWAEYALKLQPDYDWARLYLGIYYLRNKEPGKAIDHFTRQLREDPENGNYWIGLSGGYESAGEIDQAIQVLHEGTERAPELRDIYGHGFRISAKAGRREEAIGFIKKWIDRHPNDREFVSLYRDIDQVLWKEYGLGSPPDSTPPDSSAGD